MRRQPEVPYAGPVRPASASEDSATPLGKLHKEEERPVGGPAARAWGNGGYRGPKSVRFFVVRSPCCACEQQHDTQEQATDDHRSLPKERNFLPITYRFCLLHPSQSIVPLI